MQDILLRLETPGLVIFDPIVMSDFIKDNKITDADVFQNFIDHPEIGDLAISNGVALPIYPIPPDDYAIYFSKKHDDIKLEQTFSYSGFPLRCQSGILVAADIYALMDWEDDFFRNYRLNYEKHSSTNDMISTPPGTFSVTVIGGKLSNKKKGGGLAYGIVLEDVLELPKRDQDKDIEAYNFNISSHGKR